MARAASKSDRAPEAVFSEALLSALPDGVITYAFDGECRSANQAAADLLGVPLDILLDQNFREISSWKDSTLLARAEETMRAGTFQHWETYFTSTAGKSLWLSFRLERLDLAGEPILLLIFQDISEPKRMEESLRLNQISIERAADLIYWVDAEGRLLQVSDSNCRRHGYSREEMLELTIFDLDPSMSPEAWKRHWAALEAQGFLCFDTRHRTKDGEVFPLEVTANFVEHEGKKYNFAFARDITERKRLEESLRLTQLSVDSAGDLIHWVDREGHLLYVSDSTCRRHGYTREEMLGMTIFDLDPIETLEIQEQRWREAATRSSTIFESVHKTKNGELFPIEVTVNYVKTEGREYNFVSGRDISERKKAEQDLREAQAALEAKNRELEKTGGRLKDTNRKLLKARNALALQARTDPLTGCLNRRAVFSRLEQELERAGRDGGSLAVGMIDIDHFKKINDTCGHPAGDQVLCEVVARAQGALRPYDVFGRFGGEEFLVVILGAEKDEARSALERIRVAIGSGPVAVDAMKVPVRVSIGGVLWSKESAVDLIRSADEALYEAKALGRNRSVMRDLAGSFSTPPASRTRASASG